MPGAAMQEAAARMRREDSGRDRRRTLDGGHM
jgi:hypothetical protein